MSIDPLDSLRAVLLAAMGLGACTPQSPARPPRASAGVSGDAPIARPPDPPPASTAPAAPSPGPGPTAETSPVEPPPLAAPAYMTYAAPLPGRRGLVKSPDGVEHRASPQRCSTRIPDRACTRKRPGDCFTDDDCQERQWGRHGKCVEDVGYYGNRFCTCKYSCASDHECPEGKVCTCGGDAFLTYRYSTTHHIRGFYKLGYGRCVRASCTQDSDCASGLCARSARWDGCGEEIQFACRTDRDTCLRNPLKLAASARKRRRTARRADGPCTHVPDRTA